MDKENGVYIHNRVLFSHKTEQNSVVCYNIDESRGHYVKWNRITSHRKKNTITCSHSIWEAKKRISQKLIVK
jgi:hypothetical protein